MSEKPRPIVAEGQPGVDIRDGDQPEPSALDEGKAQVETSSSVAASPPKEAEVVPVVPSLEMGNQRIDLQAPAEDLELAMGEIFKGNAEEITNNE